MKAILTYFVTALTVLAAEAAHAKPQLAVTFQGVNESGNNTWEVAVAPDPAFFSTTTAGFGSSLAVELAFQVDGSSIVSTVENDVDWDFDLPGHNPFTDTVTDGMWISSPTSEKAFGSFGSRVFTSGELVTLFTMETLGSDPTTVFYGSAASPDDQYGTSIFQAGENFPDVGGGAAPSAIAAQTFFAMFDGEITSEEVTLREFTGYSGAVSSVPEPATAVLGAFALAAGLIAARPRRRG